MSDFSRVLSGSGRIRICDCPFAFNGVARLSWSPRQSVLTPDRASSNELLNPARVTGQRSSKRSTAERLRSAPKVFHKKNCVALTGKRAVLTSQRTAYLASIPTRLLFKWQPIALTARFSRVESSQASVLRGGMIEVVFCFSPFPVFICCAGGTGGGGGGG